MVVTPSQPARGPIRSASVQRGHDAPPSIERRTDICVRPPDLQPN
jgi:hypothetical protein